MALLLIIVILGIMIPLVSDMNYDARTEFEIAMNYKRKAEAKVLARSSVAFAVVIFDLQKQVENALKNFGLPKIEIWDIIPIDTTMLRTFLGAGPFASIDDLVEKKPPSPGEKATEGATVESDTAEEGDPLFDFAGDFRITFENEDSKINLNLLDGPAKDAIVRMISAVIEPESYDFIFLENTSRPEYVTREELVGNIVDWVDGDGERYPNGGDESALYADFTPRYQVKNARFDTVEELRMVYGMDDIIFRLLYPHVTIYSLGKINVNKAHPYVIESLIRAYAADKSMTVFYNQEMMRELMGKILAKRARDGFTKDSELLSILREEGINMTSAVKRVITTEGNIYRIRAVGEKEGVESWVDMVVDRKGNLYYYKEG